MRERFQQFMIGRYGVDQLGQFLNIVILVLLVLGLLFSQLFSTLGLGLIVFTYYRIFSRNVSQRASENELYLKYRHEVVAFFHTRKQRFDNRGTYRYYRCPSCKQDLRVPKGKGAVTITCPKCATQFEKKS